MKANKFLTALCLSLALCNPAFCGDATGCRRGHFREWVKAVFTVTCKSCKSGQDAPAPEAAPKDAPKTDAAPTPPTPAATKAP
jgi:hypothetical protein